jgi:hypothetical protein
MPCFSCFCWNRVSTRLSPAYLPPGAVPRDRSIQFEFDDLRAEVEQARADAERERAAKEQERAAKEQERAAKDEALAEIERLKRLLADKPEPSDPGTR